MKKIFTLLFAVGMFTLAQAQPGSRDNRQTDRRDDQRNDQRIDQRDENHGYDNQRDVVYERNSRYDNDNRYNNGIISPNRKRDMMISQVNREYDYKVMRVRNSFFFSRWEKQRQLRSLEDQRQREIRMIYIRFNTRMDRNNDHDYGNRRY